MSHPIAPSFTPFWHLGSKFMLPVLGARPLVVVVRGRIGTGVRITLNITRDANKVFFSSGPWPMRNGRCQGKGLDEPVNELLDELPLTAT